MTTYLGKSCSFCLPRVPFVNCRQFMYLVISLLVLRAGYGIWLYQFLIIAYLFTFQISLGIRPVWSESLLCAQWVAKGSVLLQADSEDSDQTGRMRRLIWVFAGRSVKDSLKQKPGLHGRNLSSTYFHDFYTRWRSLKSTPFLDVIKQCRKTHKLRKR